MKKILSLVLALLMSASAASFVGAAEEAAIAEDTAVAEAPAAAAETSQYDEAIAFLHNYGIYKGKSATDLAAADPIERYQMALFVARISTGWVDDAKWAVADQWYDRDHDTSGFDDLEGTPATNYLGALSYASQKGIIEGYGNKKFGPTDGITYQNALTMIVRTLGYTNLAWPWGYIEKAVTLGLTVGIPSSVKYTDELNRGEVAQLIYNALFIPTKEGDTLAARNFNGELGWETIIVTVAGRGRYIVDESIKEGTFPSDAGNKIGFNVVKEDGTLDATTYYVKNDDTVSFHFEQHEERYLGYAYKALFTKDENSEYVTLINLKPLQENVVWNFGLPTKGEDGKYPIDTFLAGKTLVSKFSKNTYLNTLNGEYGIQEFLLKSALQGGKVTVKNGRKYAIDWTTGNILQLNADNKGAIKADISKIDGVERPYTYDVAWYYNELLNQYFRFKVADKNGEIEYVGIDILDPTELQALIDDGYLTKEVGSKTGLGTASISASHAYASLVPFSIPGYTTPNYGLYEEYRFGVFHEQDDLNLNDYKAPGYTLEHLDVVAKAMYKEVTGKDDYQSQTVKLHKEGSKNDQVGFISEDSIATPSNGDYIIYSVDEGTGEIKVVKIIYDASNEKADKDNFVATGVVRAYNVPNKTVTIGETKYSYDYNDLLGNPFYASESTDKTWGPLYRAAFTRYFKSLFNQYVKYVVVDGKLVWVELAGKNNNVIVVDSYAGLSSDGYIVVNGYKSDDLTYSQFRIGSYNGWVKGDYYYYLTKEAVEDSFRRGSLYRITSYDKTNDVYYVYTIGKDFVSVPVKDGNGYIVHYHDQNGNIIEVTDDYMSYDTDDLTRLNNVYGFSGKWVNITLTDGYRKINSDDYVKTTSKDKYILVCNPIDNGVGGGDYAPIIVYTGSGKNGWAVSGYRINGVGDNTFLLVGVNLNDVIGFNADQYDMSYVLFLHYDYETASYDGADADSWYLLGASAYTARVFNWYNGEIEVKNAVNKDLKIGYSYPSISGWIVNDAPYEAYRLDTEIPAAYQWQNYYSIKNNTLHYMFGMRQTYFPGTPFMNANDVAEPRNGNDDYKKLVWDAGIWSKDGDTWKAAMDLLFNGENFSKYVLSPDKGLGIQVKDLVKSLKVFLVDPDRYDVNDNPLTIGEITKMDRDSMRKWIVDNNIDSSKLGFWYICDKEGNVVVYFNADAAKYKVTHPEYGVIDFGGVTVESNGSANNAGNKLWFGDGNAAPTQPDTDTADIKVTLSGLKGAHKGEYVNVSSIALKWVKNANTNLDLLSHREVDLKEFHFGRTGYCEKENFYFKVTDAAGNVIRAYDYADTSKNCVITEIYDAQKHDEDTCDLIQALEIPIGPVAINNPAVPTKIALVPAGSVTPEPGIRVITCGGGCDCVIAEIPFVYDEGNFDLDELTVKNAIDTINAAYAAQPVVTNFSVYFRDSSDTEYTFDIAVSSWIKVKASVNAYGHWFVEFDSYQYNVEVTNATITGQNYDFTTLQPSYKDLFVNAANRVIAVY